MCALAGTLSTAKRQGEGPADHGEAEARAEINASDHHREPVQCQWSMGRWVAAVAVCHHLGHLLPNIFIPTGWLLLFFGGDSASAAFFPFPLGFSVPCLAPSFCFLFSPCVFCQGIALKLSKCIRLQTVQQHRAHLLCKWGKGEGLVATLSLQCCVSDGLFSALCHPNCSSLWVLPPVTHRRATARCCWQLPHRAWVEFGEPLRFSK